MLVEQKEQVACASMNHTLECCLKTNHMRKTSCALARKRENARTCKVEQMNNWVAPYATTERSSRGSNLFASLNNLFISSLHKTRKARRHLCFFDEKVNDLQFMRITLHAAF